MTEKIIDEVMGLVYLYTNMSMKAWRSSQEDREKYVLEAAECHEAICAKLREVLERKPLTDEQIEQETGAKIGQPIFLVAKGFVQATERAHRISS